MFDSTSGSIERHVVKEEPGNAFNKTLAFFSNDPKDVYL